MSDLTGALAHVEAAVEAAEAAVGAEALAAPLRQLTRASERLGFLGDSVVVALVGGTGSGKSSLLNAIAGRSVVATGAIRPTTERPLAWVPRGAEPALGRLLDAFGIEDRETHADGGPLAIVDLPDLDSIELAHHATVDALLPRIDLVVWVLDPQKYNDRSLHDRIASRARHAASSVFVLNRADTLREDDLALVVDDLRRTLQGDGFEDPTIAVTAAAPPDREPTGIEELRELLGRRVADKGLALEKLRSDVLALADAVEAALGEGGADLPSVERAWIAARADAARGAAAVLVDQPAVVAAGRAGARTAVTRGSGPVGRLWHGVRRSPVARAVGVAGDAPDAALSWGGGDPRVASERAGAELSRALVDVSRQVPAPTARRLRASLPPEVVDRHARESIAAARQAVRSPDEPVRRWWPVVAVLQTLLTLAVLGGAVWWWADPAAVRPGVWPWPVLLVVGGLLLSVGLARLVRASGTRAGRSVAQAHRRDLEDAITERLDRRLGTPVADALAAIRTAQAELAAVRAALSA